jgi:hypothetical protein
MAEYQSIEMSVLSVLSALRTPGESISGLSRVEASIASDLNYDEDKKDDTAKPEARPVVAARTDADDKDSILFGQPLMSSLTRRSTQENAILDENTALSTQAASQVSTGQKDLLATVALAAVLYEGYRHRDSLEATAQNVERFIEEKKNEMRAAGGGGASEAAIEARAGAIREKAMDIHNGMLESQETGGQRLLAAVEYFVANPMRDHMDQSAEHMQKATAHLEKRLRAKLGRHPGEHLRDFNQQVENWQTLKDGTLQQLEAQLDSARRNLSGMALPDASGTELYAALSSRLKLDDIMGNLSNYADANATVLGGQAAIFKHIHKKTQEHQQEVADLFTGKPGNMRQVASDLGMKERDLRLAAMQYRIASDQPVGDGLMDGFKRDMTAVLHAGRQSPTRSS